MTQEFAKMGVDPELVASSGIKWSDFATITPDRLGDLDLYQHSTIRKAYRPFLSKMMSEVFDIKGGEEEMENALRLFNDSLKCLLES